MKKLSLTWIIIIAGIASALIMLINAFVPGLYKAFATKTLMLVLMGVAVVIAPAKKVDIRCFATQLCVMAVLGVLAWAYDKFIGAGYLKILIFATLAALAMIALKQPDFAFPMALLAGSTAVYAAGSLQAFELIGVAFAIAYACLNARKITSVPVRILATAIICLAMCAFR